MRAPQPRMVLASSRSSLEPNTRVDGSDWLDRTVSEPWNWQYSRMLIVITISQLPWLQGETAWI
jgi:hypothetical protein